MRRNKRRGVRRGASDVRGEPSWSFLGPSFPYQFLSLSLCPPRFLLLFLSLPTTAPFPPTGLRRPTEEIASPPPEDGREVVYDHSAGRQGGRGPGEVPAPAEKQTPYSRSSCPRKIFLNRSLSNQLRGVSLVKCSCGKTRVRKTNKHGARQLERFRRVFRRQGNNCCIVKLRIPCVPEYSQGKSQKCIFGMCPC